MKLAKFSALLFPILLFMAACTGGGEYKIAVTFPDDSFNNTQLYLTSYDSGDTIDSVIIENKCAELKGVVDTAYYARLIANNRRVEIIVEPGNIAVDWTTGVATGTKQNDALNNIDKSLTDIYNKYEKVSEDFKNNLISEEEAQKKGDEINDELTKAFHKVFEDNSDNAIGPWALYQWLMTQELSSTQIDSVLNNAPAHFKNMKRFRKAQNDAIAKEKTAEGKQFIDFSVTDEKGTTRKLSDYVGKDKILIVDFWASWCGPCRAEIEKSLKPLYLKYNGKGVKIVGVAVWDKPDDTYKAIADLEIPWEVIVGDHYMTEQTDLYGIAGIPHIMILDKNGKIISRGLQGQQLIDFVDKQMK